MVSPRHFLDIGDFEASDLRVIIAAARSMKEARRRLPRGSREPGEPLKGRVLAMIFERPSTRTRVSFEVAMRQLGGETLVLPASDMQLGRGETIADTARVLSRYVDAIMIRTDDHAKVEALAAHATVPVINGLTDLSHPCQLLADMQTVIEHRSKLAGSRWAWIGDGNNVCNSLIEAAALMHFQLAVAAPSGFEPDTSMIALGSFHEGIYFTHDPREAIAGAEVVVTDTWTSMGQSDEAYRRERFAPFQVDDKMMALAAPNASFLHCLPVHRGEEVTASVIDGPQSVVWDEAENRLHAQKALLLWALGRIG